MKPIEYRHLWSADKTEQQEMEERFGELLNVEDTADSYEVAESHLFKKGKKYYLLTASGCSCWDGDYYGWELTKTDLIKMAKKQAEGTYEDHELLMARWILENVKTK